MDARTTIPLTEAVPAAPPPGPPPPAAAARAAPARPELDVRAIPHAIRHASVFGAWSAIPAGGSLVIVAPHDPKPLLAQIAERAARSAVTYLVEGPDAWRLQITRG